MIRTLGSVRHALTISILLISLTTARAQEQEKKLLDRLLKPDMTLQNDAQGKQFVTSGGGAVTKTARTKSFLFFNRKPEKQFGGVRNFAVKDFSTKPSAYAKQDANLSTRNRLTKLDLPYETPSFETRSAPDAEKAVPSPRFPGARQFLVKGKSQKSLSVQHPPMTIEEVRELLNKNK